MKYFICIAFLLTIVTFCIGIVRFVYSSSPELSKLHFLLLQAQTKNFLLRICMLTSNFATSIWEYLKICMYYQRHLTGGWDGNQALSIRNCFEIIPQMFLRGFRHAISGLLNIQRATFVTQVNLVAAKYTY